jgi:hypothetical protein
MSTTSSEPSRLGVGRVLAGLSAAVLVAGVGGAAAATAATSHADSARHGTEHIVIMGASAKSSVDSVIATGPFTAGGSINLASTGKVTLDGGTLTLVPSFGPSRNRLNQSTCLVTISGRGTYVLGHGSHRYAGISGSGRFTLNIRQVNARLASGKCSATRAVAYQGVITASGPVTIRG